ncbi:MAG: HAMP domain-containing methyl-accepting chemotaxis protein [Caulobacteraceae bacterium]
MIKLSSINQKVMAAGAAVFLIGAMASGSGLWVAFHLTGALSNAENSAKVLRGHMDADMMHDALRADVLNALRTGAAGLPMTEVRADLKEHADRFRADVNENKTLATDPATKAALAAIDSDLNAYIAGAEQMVELAATNPTEADARFAAFAGLFSKLEGGMGDATDKIESVATAASDNAKSAAKFAQMLMMAIMAVAVAFAGLLIWMARNVLVRPIIDVTTALTRLAENDLSVVPPHADRGDEIGQMSRALDSFKQAVAQRQAELEAADQREQVEAERKENEARRAAEEAARDLVVSSLARGLSDLSEGNLTSRLDQAFPDQYEQLRRDFNTAMGRLEETLVSVVGTARGIHGGSGEISSAADDLSRRTEQQAASLEETAAALDEVTATVRKSAEGASQAREVADSARTEADRSGEVVRRATEAMSAIEESSRQISNIIGIIEEIAFQTNLLALNAGVEAARAGEAGRGFAVVASEVRALAQRSADAAKEIKTLISASSRQVGEGVELVTQTGVALSSIGVTVAQMNALVGEIAASAREQATALHEVNTAINQMDQVTQQNAAMVEETTAASHSLAREAEGLAALIGRFQVSGGGGPARGPLPVRTVTSMKHTSRSGAAVRSEPVTGEWEAF